MKSIYQQAIQQVEDGAKFRVDFLSRSLQINGKWVIKGGEYEGDLGIESCSNDEFFSNIERLYQIYKHSVPSERSESKSRQYFKALPERKLSDEAMLYGERRDKAQIELELYLLCHIIKGFEWDAETFGTWFWQSKTETDLVILRSWVEPNQSNN
ncbi:MAG: hypothetical protein SNH27_13035 [Rikenellaceae bacterium]